MTNLEKQEQQEYQYINLNYVRNTPEWKEARVRHYCKWAIKFAEVGMNEDAFMFAEASQENGYDAYYTRYGKQMPNFTGYDYRQYIHKNF